MGWKPHTCGAGQDGESVEALAVLVFLTPRCYAAKPRQEVEERKQNGRIWEAGGRREGNRQPWDPEDLWVLYPEVNREPLERFNQEHGNGPEFTF